MEPQTAIDRYRAIWGHRSEWRELLTKVDIDAPIMAQTARHVRLVHIWYSATGCHVSALSSFSSLCIKRRKTASRASHLATSPTKTGEGR
jgi:hypothetical protein